MTPMHGTEAPDFPGPAAVAEEKSSPLRREAGEGRGGGGTIGRGARSRRRRGWTGPAAAAGFLLAALAVAAPAAARSPLDRTDERHLPPVPPGGYDLPLAPPVVRFPLPPQWVTIRSTQDWRRAGRFEKKMSDACAARAFRERMPMRFRAFFKGEMLGVAFGHGLNLVDSRKLADPKRIYLFRNGDSTACTVVSITNEDARVLNDDQPAAPAPRRD